MKGIEHTLRFVILRGQQTIRPSQSVTVHGPNYFKTGPARVLTRTPSEANVQEVVCSKWVIA